MSEPRCQECNDTGTVWVKSNPYGKVEGLCGCRLKQEVLSQEEYLKEHGADGVERIRHRYDPASSLLAPDPDEREVETLRAQLRTVLDERDTLRNLVEAQEILLSGGRCSYCDHIDLAEEMPKHIETCAKHPLAAARAENSRLTYGFEVYERMFYLAAADLERFQGMLVGRPGVCDSPPSCVDLMNVLCDLERERDALAKFKAYVHQRLDAAGVPVDPDSPHKAAGCRIGGRLDFILSGLETLSEQCVEAEDDRAALRARVAELEAEQEPIEIRLARLEDKQ